jgi:hypothetical protein
VHGYHLGQAEKEGVRCHWINRCHGIQKEGMSYELVDMMLLCVYYVYII